jgi:hypothetical protein
MKRMLVLPLVVFGCAALLTTAPGCAKQGRRRPVEGGPVDTGSGTTRAARDYLEGRWALVSFEVRPTGRDPIQVKGSGMLVYDAYGNLKMDIRVDDTTSAALSGAGVPIQGGMLSTEGRAAVDMGRKTLTYVIEGQPPLGAPSGPLATNRPRYWEVEGNVLTLSTKDDAGQIVSVGKWQKQP